MKLNKVLIVEDDLLLSIVEERLVQKLGFEVVGRVMSGEDAVRKFDELNPDILLMDIQLSGNMDGLDAVEMLRKRNIDIPVIFLSGNMDQDAKLRAEACDCVDYLLKPVNEHSLRKPMIQASMIASKESQHAA